MTDTACDDFGSVDWLDMTRAGSCYEEQVDYAGRWRHRRMGFERNGLLADAEWKPGPAPDRDML